MPELPEVETVAQGLSRVMQGKRVTGLTYRRKDMRIPLPKKLPEQVKGACIEQISRRAKYLLFQLDNGLVLIAHLGMSGTMRITPQYGYEPRTHDHVILALEDGSQMVFHDPRRFGLFTAEETMLLPEHPLLRHLGVEPLEKAFNTNYLQGIMAKRKTPIKNLIMDQKVVVGVGNIYACEALFLSGIHPWAPANKLQNKADELVKHIRAVLKSAIKSGGSTLRDYVRSTGDPGYFQHHFVVYGRENEACIRCQEPILRRVQSGRSTFFCASCQPE